MYKNSKDDRQGKSIARDTFGEKGSEKPTETNRKNLDSDSYGISQVRIGLAKTMLFVG